jgi:hypothetical protein
VPQQVGRLNELFLKTGVAQHSPTLNLNGENFHHHLKRFQIQTVLLSAAVKYETPYLLPFRSLASPRPNAKLKPVRAPPFSSASHRVVPRSRMIILTKSPATGAALPYKYW